MPTVPGQAGNPYLTLIEQDKRDADNDELLAQIPTAGTTNPYESLLLADKKRSDTALNAALQPAVTADPDKYAGELATAKQVGLPVGVVQADPVAAQNDYRMRRVAETVSKSPLLQAWMTQDDNAILAMDDTENLSGLEQAMRSVGDVVMSPFRGFDVSMGQGIAGLGRLNDAASRAITGGIRAVGLETTADVLEKPIPYWANPSNWAREAGGVIERSGGPALPEDRRNIATDVSEGLGTLIGQAVATRINPTAGVSVMAGQGAEQAGRRAEEAGATTEQQDKAAVLGATITAASEKLGLDLLLNRMPPAVKNRAAQWIVDKAIAGGIEGTEEAVEQVGQNLVAQMLYDPNAPIFEGVQDSATVGAAVGVIARSLLGIRARGFDAQQAKSEQTTLDGMVAATQGSKLAQRAPERFEGLVKEMAQAGAENVYVPGETIRTLYQSLEPAQVAEQLGVPVEVYLEAVLTGGDVAIPVESYLARVAPQHHDALREVARFTPGSMTAEETAELEEEAKGAAERFMASVQNETPSDVRVRDDVTGMLLGTSRFRREDVEKYAQVLQAGFRTLAAREGTDAFSLYSQYRLRIKSELPAALTGRDIDTVIDPLIDRLRTGDRAKDTRVSLADFIADGGGVTDAKLRGELATLHENDRVVRRGKRRLVRPDAARDLDRAREAAAEAGYLSDDSDVNDLLALLDQEMSGRPVYAEGDESTPGSERNAAMDSLDEELSRRGIDVQKATNAEIKAALFGDGDVASVPDELVQVFDQVPVEVAKTLDTPVDLPADPIFSEAVANTPGAEITDDGLLIDLVRFQKEEQTGDYSVRTGVFYLPVGSSNARHYKTTPSTAPNQAYGGNVKVQGQTLLRRPLFVKGATGGKAPEAAFIAIHGKEAFKAMEQDISNMAGSSSFMRQRGELDEIVYDMLQRHGGDPDMAWQIVQNSKKGNQLRYAVQENIVAHAVRAAGYDSVIGYSKGKKGASISEVFDVREIINPTPDGEFELHPDFDRARTLYQSDKPAEFTAKTKGGEFRLTDERAAAGADFSEFGEVREVVAYDGDKQIGSLLYANDGTPPTVEVEPEYRRKGVATAMLKLAKQSGGVLGDAETGVSGQGRPIYRTDDGQAFRSNADENAVEITPADTTLDQSDRNAEAIRRGYIKFGGNRQFTIALLEKADATTFLHETGHFFLEVLGDLAADPNASPDIIRDYDAALKYLGVESREQIGTEQHEKWARSFEAYLGEGKAPSAELAPAFARFKAWVKAIYRTLRALNVELTDDVRGVFDRMLATDEEITSAEQSMDYAGLFADANSAGWTDAEFATRLQLQEQARDEAENRLMAKAMRDVTRENKAWWNERKEEVTAEVTAEVHAMPVYRAWSMLANGTEPNGTPIDGAGTKLDKAWLVQQYGQEWLNKNLLRKRVYSVAGGADPDVVATGVGFGSGDEMVRELANAQPMAAVIAAQTHQRMIDQFGDMLTDGSMPEAAMRAVHGNRRFKAMEADLRALERLAGDPRPSAQGLRRTAEAIIGQKKVRDLQPNTYLRAERKAAKEAIAAAGKSDFGLALEAQRRRLLNAHLFDVASKAKDETDKLHRYIRKFEKPALRARLGKIGRLEQVEALLSQYDLKTISGRKIDQNKARGELLALIQSGEVVAPPSLTRSLTAGQRTNWRELTVEDLRGIRDILAQTEAAARAEYEALVNGERIKLDEVAESIAADTMAGGKPVMPIYGELSPDERVKKFGKNMLASWLRPSALARLLDGGKDDGAWTRHVIQPIRRAVSEVLEPMKRKATEDLSALYKKHYTVKEMAAMNERSVVPGLSMPLSRWDVISLALNSGNADNRKAILDSEVAGRKSYTEAGVREALGTLDARDWAFVQDTWDYIDSYWPAIKEAQQRRKGIVPPKVEAQAFTITTRDGQQLDIKGGYYPLKYNARLDARARQHEMDEAFERMRAGTLSAVQTKYGHNQERVGSGRQPVMLSMNVLHSHINSVVMDLALGDAVNYVDRVLQRSPVRQSLIETGNLDALETWKLWLKDTATGEIGARSGIEQMAQFIRFGFTKSKVGFNAMTIVLQLTGLSQTIPVVGAGYTARAALDFAGRPRAAIAQVMSESKFMATRYELNSFNKDIAAVQDALRGGAPVGKGSGFIGGFINAVRAVQLPPQMVNWAFLGIRQTQILVDSTTWLAGYRKATEAGKDHAAAVLYADGIVENSQTSGMFSDRSAIERGTFSETTRQAEFVKLWTTLMSYMIAKGNIAFESYQRTDFRSPTGVAALGVDMLLLFAAEALLMAAVKGGWPDDDESWLKWTATTVGGQAISTIPFVREIPGMKYGGGNTPIGSTAKDVFTAYQQTSQAEVDKQLVKSYINLIGTVTGLPAVQINRGVDAYWREAVDGEDVPAYEYITGKRK